jgi:hypothetical protein
VASGLIGVIPVAGAGWAPGGRAFFTDPLGRAVVDFWGATHLTSAIATGLVVGRFTLVPPHAAHSRLHVALACGAGLLVMHGFRAGLLAALLLFAATWLGDRGRRCGYDDTTPAHG